MAEGTANTSLPVEIWTKIIRDLPFHYQRTCLSVSRLFHDISVQLIFASINVRLGSARDFYLPTTNQWMCDWQEPEKAEVDTAVARSYELLQHIARSPNGLASAVKSVSVRAYAFYEHNPPAELFDLLEEALSVLHLRGFAWYGCHPMPRPQVLQALSAASRETMEDLVLPAKLVEQTPLLAFRRLKSLSYLNRYSQNYPYCIEKDPCLAPMGQTIAAAPSTLRCLGTFSGAILKFDIRELSHLVELSLFLVSKVEPLGMVLTYCTRLRSLTVLVGPINHGGLAAVLREHRSAVPGLTSFQLSCGPGSLQNDIMKALAAFLLTKPLLERLEIGHHWDASRFESTEPILQILSSLPRLRVLGLEFRGSGRSDSMSKDNHLLRFSQRLPARLTALSLWVTTQFELTSVVTEAEWMQFFRGLVSCRFIHISTFERYPGTEELRRTLFDHPPPSAELVGFHEDLRWVERDPETGERKRYSRSWPLSRVYNRVVEDFGCEEWEWLLRQVDMRLLWRRPPPCEFYFESESES